MLRDIRTTYSQTWRCSECSVCDILWQCCPLEHVSTNIWSVLLDSFSKFAIWDWVKHPLRNYINIAYSLYTRTWCSNMKHQWYISAGTSDHASYGIGLLPFACWECGFEFHRWHGCLFVVCCQVEVPATCWSLVQRSPTDCDGSCVI